MSSQLPPTSRPRVESVHTEIAIFRPLPCTGEIVVVVCTPPYRNSNQKVHCIPRNLILPSIISWRHEWGRLARARARAGARHGAQERDAWLGTTRADARGRTRARATMHKNTMIEDDARGRHDAQEFQKSQNQEIYVFQKKISFLEQN